MEKLENKFYTIGIIGAIVIMLFTIFIMEKPFEIMQGVNYDFPMFLVNSVPVIILFFIVLYVVFKIVEKKANGYRRKI